jgi:hypothetical protein
VVVVEVVVTVLAALPLIWFGDAFGLVGPRTSATSTALLRRVRRHRQLDPADWCRRRLRLPGNLPGEIFQAVQSCRYRTSSVFGVSFSRLRLNQAERSAETFDFTISSYELRPRRCDGECQTKEAITGIAVVL